MNKDLRSRNQYFSTESVTTYFHEYSKAIASALQTVPAEHLELAYSLLFHSRKIFVGGNGGSASIADHLNCDFTKGTHTENHFGFDVVNMVSGQSLFTALANDEGYDNVFSKQLEMFQVTSFDVVILISSSGNSPNIVNAAKYACSVGAKVIGLTGFAGGALANLADAKLHVDFKNYGIVEDSHQILMHVLAQYAYAQKNK